MSTYRLDKLFLPQSIALVGASPRAGSLGHAVLSNLRRAKPLGELHLVNPHHASIDDLPCHQRLSHLPAPPDLVVIATPPESIPELVQQACAMGAATAVIITAGLGHGKGSIAGEILDTARRSGLRIVGPNCIGVVTPHAGLDASFLSRPVQKGNLALISQSGAIVAAMAEWAFDNHVGFSGMVSLGDQIDVDFGDCLDYFALDSQTKAILLYIEAIGDARKFLSAARAAARGKPVIVVKGGRHGAGAKAALSHTGALAGSDAVYDAAFHRAGLLRVLDLDELFAAAETLARRRHLQGERIGILTNGGGIGVLAVDRLMDFGGTTANLSAGTLRALDAHLPKTWSRANPVDIIGDADAARYGAAMECLQASDDVDAILVINCPTALGSSASTAQAIAQAVEAAKLPRNGTLNLPKPVFAVWLGDKAQSAPVFEAAGIPHFRSEADAVRGLMYLVKYNRSQKALMATPPSIPEGFAPNVASARKIIAAALASGLTWLDAVAVTQILEAYDIPVAPSRKAASAQEAVAVAALILKDHVAVAMKILSPGISHKSDAGGVRLGLRTPEAVGVAFAEMLEAVGKRQPEAHLEGVTLQPMIERAHALELIAGLADDPTFGPVVLFGHGGTAVETINDKALALPPLDMTLAQDLIFRTRISRLMAGYRDVPAVKTDAVALVLVKLAQMSADLPEIRELDLNPLLVDADGMIAVDARISVAEVEISVANRLFNPRFSIRPYPTEWESELVLPGGQSLQIRPLRPEDAPLYETFFQNVTGDDLHNRFFSAMKLVTPTLIERLTQIDYSRTMVFLAIDKINGALMGVVRLHADANHARGEYAILVRSDFKGHGLGWALMQRCIAFAKSEGLQFIDGQVLSDNQAMLKMCSECGFVIEENADTPEVKNVSLALAPRQP